MSISPIDASSIPPVQPNPTPVAGQAAPETDPTVSSSSAPATPAVQASGGVSSSSSTAAPTDAAKAADALQNSPAFRASALSFSTDQESGLPVVTVTDSKTNTVLIQIPTKEALAMTHTIDSKLRGNLIDHKA